MAQSEKFVLTSLVLSPTNSHSNNICTRGGGGGGGGQKTRQIFVSESSKIDVTSGQIGAQQPVSAKSNDGLWVRHDFYGFLSHQCQEL